MALVEKMACYPKGNKWSGVNFSCQLNSIITTQTLFFANARHHLLGCKVNFVLQLGFWNVSSSPVSSAQNVVCELVNACCSPSQLSTQSGSRFCLIHWYNISFWQFVRPSDNFVVAHVFLGCRICFTLKLNRSWVLNSKCLIINTH